MMFLSGEMFRRLGRQVLTELYIVKPEMGIFTSGRQGCGKFSTCLNFGGLFGASLVGF